MGSGLMGQSVPAACLGDPPKTHWGETRLWEPGRAAPLRVGTKTKGSF